MISLIDRDEHSWHDVTRLDDLPNRVEICLCCGGVLVTAPACATPEQVAAADAHARRLAMPPDYDIPAASSTTNDATEDE